MVIDQLRKERDYIPCTIDKNIITDEVTAYLLLNNIWKLHSLSLLLNFNQSFQFISIECEKISAKYLALKSIYLLHFIWRYMGRVKLLIRKSNNIVLFLLTINRIDSQKNW